ncbi:Pycsar system effector family protein [Methylopila sp. 73B]|uniref:Pycsar system effector family protein n=1 Tax=Methylopila sp. 73B TaxID=1120792 RepID=UPI00037F9106|nr:Pycsar system effector family protein [Methylopila sp. 73B]
MADTTTGIAYLKGVNDVFYDQIKVADQKATYILSLIILLLVWSPELRQTFLPPQALAAEPARAISLLVAAALVVALISALGVVLPRRRRGGTALFWGAWPAARSAALDVAAAADADGATLLATYADNAQNLAAICRSKYRLVSVAITSLIVAIALHGISLALR